MVTRICTLPAAGGAIRELTDGSIFVDGPEFSTDGAWIYSTPKPPRRSRAMRRFSACGRTGPSTQQITFDERVNWFPHFSPDGTHDGLSQLSRRTRSAIPPTSTC